MDKETLVALSPPSSEPPSANVFAAPLLVLGTPFFLLGLLLGETQPRMLAGWIAGGTLTIATACHALLTAWGERLPIKAEVEQVATRLPLNLALGFWTSIALGLVPGLFLLIARATGPSDPLGKVICGFFLLSVVAFSALSSIVLAILTAWRRCSLSRTQRWRGLLPLSLPVIIWSLLIRLS